MGPPSTPPPEIPTPTPAIGEPLAPLPPIAPLSPLLSTQFSGGGGPSQSDLALSPGSSNPSTSTPGGGGDTLQDCINFWDPGTHMTKAEWRAACTRTQHRLDDLDVENVDDTSGKKKPQASIVCRLRPSR
jgi:hypothetical protein